MTNKLLDNINISSDIKELNYKELILLAQEIRELIISTVSKNGGHLAANLGVVEITIALHRIFDTSNDKIVFDVGHQCYTHKILTGRKDAFSTIRLDEGLSGFPKTQESLHDAFNTGHSSTSISAALGMARARDLSKEDKNIIALIGDGALTGGMAWEAIGDAGHYGKKIIIIINDNEMSISKNVGAVTAMLSNMRSAKGYLHLKGFIAKALNIIPIIGKPLKSGIEKFKNTIKYIFVPNVMFEQMGFKYYGVVDGHDIADIEKILEHVKEMDEPVIIHIKTQKGRGAVYAENTPEDYHSTSPFDPETGIKYKENYKIPLMIGEYLSEISRNDDKICAITASMEHGCGLDSFKEEFNERFFDVGIAEQHAVTMCAGMASSGYKPIFFVYSTFLQRAYDQILHDMCMQDLGVTIVVYNNGLAGADGETHHGIFSISFLRHIPNLNIISPANVNEAKAMIKESVDSKKPTIILMPKNMPILSIVKRKEIGKWVKYTKAKAPRIAVFASGISLTNAMDAVRNDGLFNQVDIFNANYIKPLDLKTIKDVSSKYKKILTIENNVLMGGFGSAVLEILEELDYDTRNLTRLGYQDEYIPHGNVAKYQKLACIDTGSIVTTLKAMLKNE